MRFSLIVFLGFVVLDSFAQRAIVLTSIPQNTPEGAVLHLGASANGWNPGAPDWVFESFQEGWVLDVANEAPIQFQGKVTRGDWGTVEGTEFGGFIPDRTFDFTQSDTVYISVAGWEDIGGSANDLPPNVVVLDEGFFMPELDRHRRVRLFLPSSYDDTDAHYPVLYMHDGQNLFSAQEAFAGEWEIDEALLALEAEGYPGAIIVAIDNGGVHRINEYTPWANIEYGGGEGQAYVDFLVNTLKPFVDVNYRTLSGRDHTGIMGSSLGGLISHYAGIREQSVFSKVGVFSPSFWFTDDIYSFTEQTGKNGDMKFFFLAGAQESATLIPNIDAMISLMGVAGFADSEMRFDTHTDGQHSEWFWAREFPIAFEWLFIDGAVATTSELSQKEIRLYPNPSSESIRFEWPEAERPKAMYVFDPSGRQVDFKPFPAENYDVSGFEKGMYYFRFHFEYDTLGKPFVKY